jgi:hypothetical protein
LWAQVRSRGGKIVLCFLGILLAGLIGVFVGLGGFGVAIAAVRLGQAKLVARIVLSASFAVALFAALLLGPVTGTAFSDKTLRRYPLTHFERLASRYAVGLFDTLWLFVLVLDFSVAVGFIALGASPWWVAVPAAVLLFLTNYLVAGLLVEAMGRIKATHSGQFLLTLAVLLLALLSATLAPTLARNRFPAPEVLLALRFSPPFAAAALVAGALSIASAGWMLLVVGWLVGLGAALVALERKSPPSNAVAGGEATWDGLYDRVALAFGPALAPLVGKTLRYYVRSHQLLYFYPTVAIGSVLMALMFAHGYSDLLAGFLTMLGAITMVGAQSMGVMPVNVFGFDRSGFRRYFLLPVSPSVVLRAAAFVPMFLGAALVPFSLGLWLIFWRGHVDARMAVMLLLIGFGGVFLFQALALWASLLTPRALGFKEISTSRLSFAQNALITGGSGLPLGLMAGLPILGSRAVLACWWVAPLILLVAASFYLVTLHEGTRVFSARRERMLSMIERGY